MDMITDAELLRKIDAFVETRKIPPSRFGREAMGDGALIPQLREGRSLSLKNAERVLQYMANYAPPAQQDAAA